MRADSIVLETIKEHKLIQSGDILLLGLSGGPDSLCLLDILNKLQSELSFSLYALHVNHQIRGAEADRDMFCCVQNCKDRNIKLTVKIANIPEIAKRDGISEEDAGRRIRQKALRDKSTDLKKEFPDSRVRVVLAHNKDDQAETVLMRILRGTGVHGLGAMEYERADGVIRPLLDVARVDIEEYCSENNLNPCIDSTNSVPEYTRNKVRLELIPLLEKEFNPNLKEGLIRLADAAREDDAYLNSIAKRSMPEIIVKGEHKSTDDFNSMPLKQLAEMDPAVAKRVIKMMFARCGLKTDISAVHMNALLGAIENRSNATIEFPKGYKAIISYDKLSFKSPESTGDSNDDKEKVLKVSCRVFPIEELPPLKTLNKNCCALDALKLLARDCDIYVRTRRPGDKIRPLGGPGTKKLQDYMTDAKIPREERDSIKLLCCDHTVLWVKGYTISDLCKVDDDTDFVLVTKIEEE